MGKECSVEWEAFQTLSFPIPSMKHIRKATQPIFPVKDKSDTAHIGRISQPFGADADEQKNVKGCVWLSKLEDSSVLPGLQESPGLRGSPS